MQKQTIQSQYHLDLNQQEVIKKQSRDRIKREDVIYASLEKDHARNTEEKR
jgi:hypothetical protein